MNATGPRVGVAVVVLRDGLVLLGQRMGSTGSGTWALPGGHLELGEDVEACAAREVREETGLEIATLSRGPCSNDRFEGKHYVTLYVVGHARDGEPRVLEPTKCAGWRWFRWAELPTPLFHPLATMHASGYVPVGAD